MKKTLLYLLLTLSISESFAQAPVNDEPFGVITLPVYVAGAGAPFLNVSSINATYSVKPPAPSSPSSCGCTSSVTATPRDIWFKFNTGSYSYFELFISAGNFFGTPGYVRIYSDTLASSAAILCRCSASSTTPVPSFAFSGLAANTNYFIAISPKVGTSGFWGPFDLKIEGANTPLPVNFSSFEGNEQGSINLIRWSFENDNSSASLIVERKNELEKEFQAIYTFSSNNKQEISGTFEDLNYRIGTNFYRMKVIDANGQFVFSKTVSIKRLHSNEISIYPNPSTLGEPLQIVRKHLSDAANLKIFNSQGALVYNNDIKGLHHIFTIEESIKYASGLYFLKYTSDENEAPVVLSWLKQ